MILLNTTICVDEPFEQELVTFLKDIYIPSAYAAGLYKALLTKIRAPKERNSISGNLTVSYALQLRAPSDEKAKEFNDSILPGIFDFMSTTLKQSIALYCTQLDVIHDPERDGKQH